MGILVYKTHLEKQEKWVRSCTPATLGNGGTIQLGFVQIKPKNVVSYLYARLSPLAFVLQQDAAISSLCCRGLKDVAASV